MSVSFLRIDDRMIHGQTVTRWSLEYPCDGLVAVNDKAATTDALKMAYKSASTKKTFVWTYEAWKKKNQKVLDSSRPVITWSYDYFLYITWNKSIIH